MARIHLPGRFSFSLRSLFAGVAIVAVILALVIGYVQAERRFENAKLQYDGAVARWTASGIKSIEVCSESFVLYLAEHDRWFHSGEALQNHVDRLKEFESRLATRIDRALFSDFGISEKQTLSDIRAMRERFEKGDF